MNINFDSQFEFLVPFGVVALGHDLGLDLFPGKVEAHVGVNQLLVGLVRPQNLLDALESARVHLWYIFRPVGLEPERRWLQLHAGRGEKVPGRKNRKNDENSL